MTRTIVIALAVVGLVGAGWFATTRADAPCAAPVGTTKRVVAEATDDGFILHGGAGRQVSEPLTLAEGTVIYDVSVADPHSGGMSAEVSPAPGSPALASLFVAVRPKNDGQVSASGTMDMARAGAIVIAIDAETSWTMQLHV